MRSCILAAGTAALALALWSDASAHVTLESREAVAGSYHKVVLRVPHGCQGSPTTALRVRIPDGVVGVKPQPKPGWEVGIEMGPMDQPPESGHSHGDGPDGDETVREVSWTGGRLLDNHFDEFAMQVRLPDTPGEVLHFLAVQECEDGVHRWIEIPEEGRSAHDYDEPAPALRLIRGGH